MSVSFHSYERGVPSMSKAKSLKGGKDVPAFFQENPVRRINGEKSVPSFRNRGFVHTPPVHARID